MKLSRRGFLLASGGGVLAAPGVAGLVAGRAGVETGNREDSLWTSEAPSMPPAPRFEGERKVDLAIVGSGYTGLACAYYAKLFRPNWSVIVLESHGLGSGASSRNSGAVYARHVGISDAEMPKRGLDRLRRFIEAEQIDCNFAPASTLMLLSSKNSAENARSNLPPGARWISPEELRESISSGYYAGAVDTPGYFRVQPAKLVVGHVRAALRVGAELFEHSPALSVESGRPPEISTPQGNLLADHVFIATNAHTPRLGFFQSSMFPAHQYSIATRKLASQEIAGFGFDRWMLRFERGVLPVTFSLTPGGHFFLRMVLGYASFNSCEWQDVEAARNLARRIFQQRYPRIADVELAHGWHGVTAHTAMIRQIAGVVGNGNIHVSAAYNGLGIMPGHNNGYLTACQITGHTDDDTRYLTGVSGQIPLPGEFYRSLMFKPFMSLMTPV
jgi:glycine/D-amino acid oxidase-like deaminating enzyme